MIAADFTGTYDYEKEEAEHAAAYILESDYTPDELQAAIARERLHWMRVIPETFEDWDKHFTAAIGRAAK